MQTVHVRVNDAATGKPTACRVRFTDAAGNFHAPLGRLASFPSHVSAYAEGNFFDGGTAWSLIDGSCEIVLPPGPITVEIRKGLEYSPLKTTVRLAAGKLAMRFVLERWIDTPAQGWFTGDSRVHLASPHEMLLAAAAEDVGVVNLLVQEMAVPGTTVPALPNIVAFSGQTPCLESAGHLVAVNTHNVHPVLGSLGLLHCHRVVFPMSLDEHDATWTLADWCDQCHRKKGLVVWTEIRKDRPRLETENLADLILGKIDAFELDRDDLANFGSSVQAELYTLWNAGLRIPLVGGSGWMSNAQVVGRPRTYCQLLPNEPRTYPGWIEAVRARRTYVTAGPILSMNVSDPGQIVSLRAEAHSQVPFEKFEALLNGEVVTATSADPNATPAAATILQEIPVPDGGWLAVRCWGPGGSLLAHSSPVFIDRAGRIPANRQVARQTLAANLAALTEREAKRTTRNERLLHILEQAAQA